MIINYLNPVKVYKSLSAGLQDLINYLKYKKIIAEISASGKLEELGLRVDRRGNLYIGINLNPELLLYSETSQESVELKLIAEKLKKYTDFLTKEGILDFVKVEYDRIKNEEYYGYILQIKYDFTKYRKTRFTYDIAYLVTIISLLSIGLIILL
jgi:hypothetical protein